jgi:hypothetical protein
MGHTIDLNNVQRDNYSHYRGWNSYLSVDLSLKVKVVSIELYAMKTYVGVDVQIHGF